MIFSAPSSTAMPRLPLGPAMVSSPAGMRRSFTSPRGVRITTADRLPTRARATGTTWRVSSGESPKIVAMS